MASNCWSRICPSVGYQTLANSEWLEASRSFIGVLIMKAFEDVLVPDERFGIFRTYDEFQALRPLTFADHYAMAASLGLPDAVPKAVATLYSRALNVLVYGWYDYELMVLAVGQSLATLEYALRLRLEEIGKSGGGLGSRLKLAVEAGLIATPSHAESPWGNDHKMLADLRNEIAHGSNHIYMPDQAAKLIQLSRTLICELYGLTAPALAL